MRFAHLVREQWGNMLHVAAKRRVRALDSLQLQSPVDAHVLVRTQLQSSVPLYATISATSYAAKAASLDTITRSSTRACAIMMRSKGSR